MVPNAAASLPFFFFCRPSRQSRLQECLRERAELLQVQEAASRLREKEKAEYKRAREAWERRCRELERDISRLQHELRQSLEKMEEMERKQKVVHKGKQTTGGKMIKFHFPLYDFLSFFASVHLLSGRISVQTISCLFLMQNSEK